MKGTIGNVRSILANAQAVQAIWVLFLLAVLTAALPGITPFRALLATTCTGEGCLVGQLTPSEAQILLAFGDTLTEYAETAQTVYLFNDLLLLVLAAVFIWRKPENPGIAAGAFFLTLLATANLALAAAWDNPMFVLPARLLQFLQVTLFLPFFGRIPDGRYNPGWLRWAALGLAPLASLVVFATPVPAISVIVAALTLLLGLGGLAYRYHTARGAPWQEPTAWAMAGAILLAVAQGMGKPIRPLPLPVITLDMLPVEFSGFYTVFGMLFVVGALTCLIVSLLSDELFRVDIALNRAIVYSLLTLFVIGAYVLIVGYLAMVFQSSGNLWLSLVATGVVAALFHPIRQWVQRFVNRMIYGERDDPYTVLTDLGQRLESVIAPDEAIPVILRTIREALRTSYAAISLNHLGDGEFTLTAEEGSSKVIALTLPLVYLNEVVGQFLLGPRPGETGFSAVDRRLLDGLARQAGAAIHAARLNADLQRARERLVIAQEEERRRIRRDLHDGLGATLAALNLQAGEVQRLMAVNPIAAGARLADLRAGLRAAVGDTRRLVYGLRPPALDELGLLEALRVRVGQYEGEPRPLAPGIEISSGADGRGDLPVQISFHAPEAIPSLVAAAEVAVYRIVEEGLTNIVHHAQARNGSVSINLESQGIRVEIHDDGLGLPEIYTPGIGLNSMRERAAELGGTLSIQSTPGGGTQICAWLPVISNPKED
jgi:signal transduction histidine kinase